jgi:hypothetical protein
MINFLKKNKNFIISFFLITIILLLSISLFFLNQEHQVERKRTDRLFKQIIHKNLQFNYIQEKLKKNNIEFEKLVSGENIEFARVINKKKIKLKKFNQELYFSKYNTKNLIFNKNYDAIASAYLEYFDKNIVVTTGTGMFFYGKFQSKKVKFKTIKSNINKIINYNSFFQNSQYGIKDILIKNNIFYISLVEQVKKGCFTLSIYTARFNFQYLNFKRFFQPKKCLKNIYAHQGGGGRMISYDENNIIFTIGEFRHRELAQKNDNLYGKVFLININNQKIKLLSKGHRNIQGLYYDKDKGFIIATEMGPKGGDEINIITSPFNTIKNFGWPISSYGIHYSKRKIENAPLHKSHKKYGFVEPVKYFTPSIGMSEIVKIDENFYLFGGMGRNINNGSLSLNFIDFKNNLSNLSKHEKVYINDRVRDIIYIKKIKTAYLFLETTSSIGVIKFK